MREFWLESGEKSLEILRSSRDGLSSGEAEKRLEEGGKNVLDEGRKRGFAALFFSQFKDLMTILLIAAAVVSGVIAYISKDVGDLTDTGIIVFIVILNAVVGAIQQFRADKAIESLKKMSACNVNVRRDGRVSSVPSEDVTAGDIVLLSEGDVVPADCRILESRSLYVDESALTGESAAVAKNSRTLKKNAPLSGRENCIYNSTFVVRGSCEAVVYATGMATEIGAIASIIGENKKTLTPLEKTLNKLGKILTVFVLFITAFVFALGVFVRRDGLMPNFMTAVAIAVAAIPEGLPAVVTIIMAMGVQKMSRKKVVIRKLQSVETLGGCSVICSDKTGTLTRNKMKVVEVRAADEEKILKCMQACSDVKGERGKYVGDPTETALKNYADERGCAAQGARLAEEAFSSERKMMSVAVECADGARVYSKGAPDVLIKKCAYISTFSGVRPITEQDRRAIFGQCDEMAAKALRVLGFAECAYTGGGIKEENLIFTGLAGLRDELKEGVKEAVAECKAAGIKTVMITGDHVRTAFAIASALGIASDEKEVISGDELDKMNSREREKAILSSSVFARVSPRHKNVIVRALQKRGKVVAMTGDGVNDAPSVKSADIGIAMGISGAEVTKSASDMVIADDNFPTIVAAVREGRRISENVRKTVRFFLSTNLAEVLAILFAAVFFPKYAFFASTQLLWLNLITDSFPVLALGAEREEEDIMTRPPERAEKSLFSKRSVANMLFFGIYMTVLTVGVFALGLKLWGNAIATTLAFMTISFAELFHAFNIRSESASVLKTGIFKNVILDVTVAAGVILNVILCVSPLAPAFGLAHMNAAQWALALLAPLSVVPVAELYKFAVRRASRRFGGLDLSRRKRYNKSVKHNRAAKSARSGR